MDKYGNMRENGQIPVIVILRILVFFVGLFVFLSGLGVPEAGSAIGLGEIIDVISQWASGFVRITFGLILMVLGIRPQAISVFVPV